MTLRSLNKLRERQKTQHAGDDAALTRCSHDLPVGDEIGRTQRGNNNAYCQDNEISWLD